MSTNTNPSAGTGVFINTLNITENRTRLELATIILTIQVAATEMVGTIDSTQEPKVSEEGHQHKLAIFTAISTER